MSSYNKVLLMGNLTRDPESRSAGTTTVAQIGIAVSHKFKGSDGQTKEETTFIDCEAWGKTAENIVRYFTKGKPIFIEGRLKLDQWKDKNDGSNRSKLKVVVETFTFVGGSERSATNAGAPTQGGRQADGYTAVKQDDIPW